MATRTKRLRLLGEALATVPSVNCKGLCWQACGVIPLSDVEAVALEVATGSPPPLSTELRVATLAIGDDLRCRYLSPANRCTVYNARPLICRLYGVVDAMRCAHGCEPSAPMPEPAVRELIARVRKI
jgi:Fe-S-cluster containining protein